MFSLKPVSIPGGVVDQDAGIGSIDAVPIYGRRTSSWEGKLWFAQNKIRSTMLKLLDKFYLANLSFYSETSPLTFRIPVTMALFISCNWISIIQFIIPHADGLGAFIIWVLPGVITAIFLNIYYNSKRSKHMIELLKLLSEDEILKYRVVLILYVIITVGLLILASESSVSS